MKSPRIHAVSMLLLPLLVVPLLASGVLCANPGVPMETVTVMGPSRIVDVKPVNPAYRSLSQQFLNLVEAIVREDPKRVDAILKANPKLVNVTDDLGDTPLVYALTMHIRGEEQHGNAIADLLLQRGADKGKSLRIALSKVRDGSIHHYTVAHFLDPERYGYSNLANFIAPLRYLSTGDMLDALDEATNNRKPPEMSRLETLKLMSRFPDDDGFQDDHNRALLLWYRDNPSLKQGGVPKSSWHAAPIPENGTPVAEARNGRHTYRSYKDGAVYVIDEAQGTFSVVYAPATGRDCIGSLRIDGGRLLMRSVDGEVNHTYDIARKTLTWSTNIGPLMEAIDRNYINGVKAYLDRHPEMVNATDAKGDTPLIRAVTGRLYVIGEPNGRVVAILRKWGADKSQALKVALARYRNLKLEYYPVLSYLQPEKFPPLR